MPTVQEQLKAAGWTDDDITAAGDKLKGIETIFSAAQQEREQGEIARRAAVQTFENEIAPAIAAWGNKEAIITAERDYYKTLAEKAKDGGFVAEVPPFKAEPPRGPGGQFVPNSNSVPGSPDINALQRQVVGALGTVADIQWKYRSLYGSEMPISPTALGDEAGAQRMSLADYAAKKFDFAGKEAEKLAAERKAHDDAIRKEAREAADREWAEKVGSNPNLRVAQPSKYTEIRKAVEKGDRVDPLKMTREQRHAATAAAIREDVAAMAN